MTVTPEGVVAILRSTEATPERILDEVLDGIPNWDEANVNEFVAELVRKEQLTSFQAKRILGGRSIQFGKYVLCNKIQSDDLGLVFEAFDTDADTADADCTVSLRLINQRQHESTRQFELEINRAIEFAETSNSNVVSTLDFGIRYGQPYVATELPDGPSFADYVRAKGTLTLSEAIDWIDQAASGLAGIHHRGIIHHAISPLSLIIGNNGVVKVDGVGISRSRFRRLHNENGQLSAEDTVVLNCLAPELYDGRRKADHRTDLYALGCTLYYLLSGSAPYSGRTLAEKKRSHTTSPLPTLKRVCAEATDEVDRLFQKMIATKPKDRFRSVTDLAESIKMIRGEIESENHTPLRRASRPLWRERAEKLFTPRWPSQHLSLLITLAFLAVFLICILAGGLLETRNRALTQNTSTPTRQSVASGKQIELPVSDRKHIEVNTSDSGSGEDFAEVPEPMSGAFEALTFVAQMRQDTRDAENRSFATISQIRPDGITLRQAILPSNDEIEQLRQQVNDGSQLEIMRLDLSNTDTGDQDLRYFSCLSSLEAIDLRGTRVTPNGIEHLPTAPLRALSIDASHDMGSTEFEVIEKKYGETLTTLCIEGSVPQHLPELKQIKVRLPQLLKLRLPNTSVTTESQLFLKQQLVSCEVSWD